MTGFFLFGAGIVQGLYCLIMFLMALFLILLILIQRGRGGGLSGAFGGGMGGQSAFGAKAGDTFTRITIIAATIWIVLCLVGVKFLGGSGASVLVNQRDAGGPAMSSDLDLESNAADAGGDGAGGTADSTGGPSMGPPPEASNTDDSSSGNAATESAPSEEPSEPNE